MCIKIKLTYLGYGNTSRGSIEVNISVASKPFWSQNIVQRNRFNSYLLVIDFALYYCLTVHFVVGEFKIPVKIALHIVYFEHQAVAASKSPFCRFLSLFGIFTNQSVKYEIYHIISIKRKLTYLQYNVHQNKINLSTLWLYLRWSIEVNIPVACKPFWSQNIAQRNRFNSYFLVIDFALYYCLTVHLLLAYSKFQSN